MHNELTHKNNNNNNNAIKQPLKHSKLALLERWQFATEPTLSTIIRLNNNEILSDQPGDDGSPQPTKTLPQNQLQHIFYQLYFCQCLYQRRHSDRPPPSFYIRPRAPIKKRAKSAKCNVTVLGCDPLAKKLPSFIVTNANHLTNKIERLNGILDDSNASLAFVTETWFSKDNSAVVTIFSDG